MKKKQFESLPIVFGNKKSLKIFYQDLKRIDFPFTSIETLYFFESKRWDLKTKENKLIKLPVKNYFIPRSEDELLHLVCHCFYDKKKFATKHITRIHELLDSINVY